MKKVLFALVAVVLTMTASGATGRTLLPQKYEGSMMPYDFGLSQQTPVWGDSLRPVYVAHVARHGARYITSAKKLAGLRAALADASASGSLTGKGKEFSRLLSQVGKVSSDKWGDLSEVGCREEVRLAKEMHALFPLLQEKTEVVAYSSYVPRVVRTMYEYCGELVALNPRIEVTASEGKRYDALLRCFTADTAYAAYRSHGNWQPVYSRMVDAVVPTRPARALLGKSSGLSDNELRRMTLDIYDVLHSLRACGLEAPDDHFMTADEYRRCWETDNLFHYLRNTVTPLSSLAGKASSPLLARIIGDADRALSRRLQRMADSIASVSGRDAVPLAATLYFGHAETLMPLLSLMRVPGCYDDSSDFTTLSERWKDYAIVPLGANLDVIILEAPSGRNYVTLRLNGSFVSPMPGAGMVANWNTYKDYLAGVMQDLK